MSKSPPISRNSSEASIKVELNNSLVEVIINEILKENQYSDIYKDLISEDIHLFIYPNTPFLRLPVELMKEIIEKSSGRRAPKPIRKITESDKKAPPLLQIAKITNEMKTLIENTNAIDLPKLKYENENFLFYAIRFSLVRVVYTYIKKDTNWMKIKHDLIVSFFNLINLI